MPPQDMARRGLAVVPQGRIIFPLLTVTENLQTGFALLPKSEHRVPGEIYDLFPVLKDMGHRRGGNLSGGQQQQLAIARVMIMRPRILLLDEPTGGIQPNIIQQIGSVIGYLKARGDIAIVLVEQYFDSAYGCSDGFVVLQRGAVAMARTERHAGTGRPAAGGVGLATAGRVWPGSIVAMAVQLDGPRGSRGRR